MREAEKIGPATLALFEAIMRAKPHPEQGFRACLGILRLAKGYGVERLDADTDVEALTAARQFAKRCDVEVWLLDRKIGRLERTEK